MSTSNFLLDTHVFLWWITDDERLSSKAKVIISNPENKVFFSSVSAFEISVKAKLGRLTEVGDPLSSVPFHVKRNYFEELPLTTSAALRTYNLPELHADPFDRLLIGQCIEHNLQLLSADKTISRYPIKIVW